MSQLFINNNIAGPGVKPQEYFVVIYDKLELDRMYCQWDPQLMNSVNEQ